MQTLTEYDALLYEGIVFPKTDPSHLATMAALHGLDTRSPFNCRVLELGCGDGFNLLAQAYSYPKSEFVGVDLSAAHVQAAQAYAAEIGANNIMFLHADVLQLAPVEIGKFDFITAHGLYSWVPKPVREHMLSIYSDCLSANGVGYISYNVYPGCRLREMLWDGMRYYTRSIEDTPDKVSTARVFANVLLRSIEDNKDYKSLYEREVKALTERPDYGVAHDDLSPVSQPFYFHQFAERLESHDLKFICESDPRLSFTGNFNETANGLLDTFRGDQVEYQQAIDFIRCGRFRASLVCKPEVALSPEIDIERIPEMYMCAGFSNSASPDDLLNETEVEFKSQHDASITVRDPFLKNILADAFSVWPRKIRIEDTLESLRTKPQLASFSDFDKKIGDCKNAIKTLFQSGAIRLSKTELAIPETVGERPLCSAFARLQIERGGDAFCALDGHVFNADNAIVKGLVVLADGTLDRNQLIAELSERIEVNPSQREEFLAALPGMIDESLEELRLGGVLVPNTD